ncbi:MAG: peptidase M15 [Gammaproteobacteria bacterium AqS3]|nr:peptidase M15 [Gammaproteobacteria bacterium AqS3]
MIFSNIDGDLQWKRNFNRMTFPGVQYFKTDEHQCLCGKCVNQICHPALYLMLDDVRGSLDEPLVVNSGYRCKEHNASVGGRPLSKHLKGCAVDVATIPMRRGKGTKSEVFRLARIGEQRGFKGIGVYNTWVHLDIRSVRAVWGPMASEYLKL